MITKLTAITGGIGAGKSVVSHILRVMGYEVFDCDSEAKAIMDNNDDIKSELKKRISLRAIDENGNIDRKHISSIVFQNPEKLEQLNQIVHAAVRHEIERWKAQSRAPHIFVETAILYQSQLDKAVDDVWDVVAPVELRVKRVIDRNRCTRREVLSRIESQTFVPEKQHAYIHTITNDEHTPLLPQILKLLQAY